MGKFKKASKFISNVGKVVKSTAVPLSYAVKYNKELATAAKYGTKGARFLGKSGSELSKLTSSKGGFKLQPNLEKMVLDATLGYAKKKGEAYLDKKLSGYKSYRIGKGLLDTAYDVGSGNYLGAVRHATNVYAEADPNKKRAAKVKGVIAGGSKILSGATKGNLAQAYEGASQVYAVADPNKKRVRKFQSVNANYIAPSVNMYQGARDIKAGVQSANAISSRSKAADFKQVLAPKINRSMTKMKQN